MFNDYKFVLALEFGDDANKAFLAQLSEFV